MTKLPGCGSGRHLEVHTPLPEARLDQCHPPCQASDHALQVPGEGLPAPVFHQYRNRDGVVQSWLQVREIALIARVTNRQGISSGRVPREPEVTPRTAWFLHHRLRDACAQQLTKLAGPVEMYETCIGGKVRRTNRQRRRWRKNAKGARGSAGKTPVNCIKDRTTGKIQVAVFSTRPARRCGG